MKTLILICFIFCAILCFQGITDGGNTIECYYCINDCEPPLNTLNCEALDNNVSCYSSISTNEDGTTEHLKGCSIDEDTDFQDFCNTTNVEGGSCYTCQEDLCNEAN
ncbi:hypothetical protein Zmor_023366 [Zophobas morio]|uniref:Secreted protein n=1 Tax=Zophobas morio TaxID=2755281 RepID=A0AA38M7B3_9CUCU|nr:hypothetical protein Zmor_023366 [Zophobas morio]